MTEKRRIFVGTFLAEREKQVLGALRESCDTKLTADWQCKIRWVRPEKLHMTWFFIGDVNSTDLSEISDICRQASANFPASELSFSNTAFWPSARGARMMVLTPEMVPDEVVYLQAAIKKQCAKFAEKMDKRYRPHITLMRFEGVDRKQRLVLPEDVRIHDQLPVPLIIDSISVIESHLGANGAYEALDTFPLNGAPMPR